MITGAASLPHPPTSGSVAGPSHTLARAIPTAPTSTTVPPGTQTRGVRPTKAERWCSTRVDTRRVPRT